MNNLDKKYLDLLKDIKENGVRKVGRNGATYSVFGRQIRHDMRDGFPLLTTKKMYWKGIVTELLWFLSGSTDIRDLWKKGITIWDGDWYKNYQNNTSSPYTLEEIKEKVKTGDHSFHGTMFSLGPIYGKQWRDWNNDGIDTYDELLLNKKGRIDQIQNLLDTLTNIPDSRRMMVIAWNVGELDNMTLPPCFVGDTLIATDTGTYKKISNIGAGDIVLTDTGEFNEVYDVMETEYNGDIYSIRTHASPYPIKCTPNHPILVKDRGYISSDEIHKGDYLGIPINTTEKEYNFEYELKDNQYSAKTISDTLSDKREWYLMGYFLGDGWLSQNKGSVLLAINDNEFDKINSKIDGIVPLSKLSNSGQNFHKYEFKQKRWEVIFDKFGNGAKNKQIPDFIFNGKRELIESFIEGYEDSDGCETNAGKSITTISDNIALGIQRLYAKVGKKASLYYQNRPKKTMIGERVVNQNNTYSINTYKQKYKSKNYIFDERILWVKVDSIEKENFNGNVYNLSVNKNHTYTANNLINHNCHYGFQVWTRELTLEERLDIYEKKMEGKIDTTEVKTKESLDERRIPKRGISLMFNMRSTDVPLGLPFNIASYGLLLEMIANEMNMVPLELIYNGGDVHIYENQLEGVEEQLKRKSHPLPTVELEDGIYSNSSDIHLENYVSEDTIKFPLSN